jgi:hypothetical protein
MAIAPCLPSDSSLKLAYPTEHTLWSRAMTRWAGCRNSMPDVRCRSLWLQALPCAIGAEDAGCRSVSGSDGRGLDKN